MLRLFHSAPTKWTTTKVPNLHKRIELPFQVTREEKFTQLQIQCARLFVFRKSFLCVHFSLALSLSLPVCLILERNSSTVSLYFLIALIQSECRKGDSITFSMFHTKLIHSAFVTAIVILRCETMCFCFMLLFNKSVDDYSRTQNLYSNRPEMDINETWYAPIKTIIIKISINQQFISSHQIDEWKHEILAFSAAIVFMDIE